MNTAKEMINEALKCVDTLNEECSSGGEMDYIVPFVFEYIGWQDGGVKFMGQFIWSIDNDEREYLPEEEGGEKESLYSYLKRTAEEITKDLTKKIYQTNIDILKQYNDFLDLDIVDSDINEFLSGYYE